MIAAMFLAAYLNVFVIQASCNLLRLFEETTVKSSYHHDGSQNHHHDGKSEKKDNNCCNEKTSAFFASLGNQATASVDFKNTYSEFDFINVICFVFDRPAFNTNGYISYSLPPPKIPDIRVFIHSFII